MYKVVRPMLLSTVEADMMVGSSVGQNAFNSTINSSSSHKDKVPRRETNNESKTPHEVVRIPQKHFHGMSKDKVKKCVEALCEGSTLKLRLDGEKDALERRHRDFVHLHNSQIGKDKPMSIEAIVKECTKREAMRYLIVSVT
jgi:hypothetical protein